MPLLTSLEVTSSLRFVCFYIASWWQSPFFDGCWPIAFGVLSFAKVSFRLLACVLRISMGTNLEVTSSLSFCLYIFWGWQNHFFDGYWPIVFRVLSFAKFSFRLLPLMLLISPLTDLEITSFLRFRLCVYCFMMTKSIVWWLLNHHFRSSVFCEGQLSLVSMYPPVFTARESRSCFIVEVLSLCTLFHVDKIHSLMFVDPSLLESCLLRSSAFAY